MTLITLSLFLLHIVFHDCLAISRNFCVCFPTIFRVEMLIRELGFENFFLVKFAKVRIKNSVYLLMDFDKRKVT